MLLLAAAVLAAWLAATGCEPRPTVGTPAHIQRMDPPPDGIQFEEVAAARGIGYRWPEQPKPMRNLEAFGCGCAFLDYDNDGWMDILLTGKPHPMLYRNKGNGQFEDATESAGLAALTGDWKGCGVGDFDGDGFLDLCLTGYAQLALLRNDAGRHFTDVTVQSGLDPHNRGHWGSSAGFMDLDGDGNVDLVLLNYVIFGPKEEQYCELTPGVRSGCPPSRYRPEFGEMWQNIGKGRFRDVTASSGMKSTNGKALVMAFTDIDNDGRIDFYLGNDGTPADLMWNQGGMRFKNVGITSGAAYGEIAGHAMAAMGADWADYDRDGRPDLCVTGFADEAYIILHNLGRRLFEHTGDATGISGPTLKPLGFGAKWLDMDNDGWPDLSFTNGHVYDNAQQIDPLSSYRQPLMLFHNEQGKQFRDLVPALGGDVAKPIVGRGSATGDIDNDGRIDLLVVDYEGAPLLLHNTSQTKNHWITLDLRAAGPNRFAYGAQVTARSGGNVWIGTVSPASSYLSSSDPRIHFGLGDQTALETVTIRWSTGQVETLHNVAGDRIVRVEHGKGIRPHPSANASR